MKDSTTYDFAEEMGDGRKFLCRCVQSAINSLSTRLVHHFRLDSFDNCLFVFMSKSRDKF